jgi:NTP pyrophosphatase (non-canonical NTP hydrolase)
LQEGNDLELEQSFLSPKFYKQKLDTRNEFLAGGRTVEEFKECFELMKKEYEIRNGNSRRKRASLR